MAEDMLVKMEDIVTKNALCWIPSLKIYVSK